MILFNSLFDKEVGGGHVTTCKNNNTIKEEDAGQGKLEDSAGSLRKAKVVRNEPRGVFL